MKYGHIKCIEASTIISCLALCENDGNYVLVILSYLCLTVVIVAHSCHGEQHWKLTISQDFLTEILQQHIIESEAPPGSTTRVAKINDTV